MGNTCCNTNKQSKDVTLLLLGLDNAGKTVAAKKLAGEPADSVLPTVGFSVVHLLYEGCNVELYDLGGGPGIRGIWDKYFVYAHGIIFVVDSSDFSRLNEAKEVLHDVLYNEKVSGKPVLLLANKQDNENALDEIDIVEKMQLETLVNNRQCPTLVESCCADQSTKNSVLDSGIKKGYRWLMNYIVREYDELNKRVGRDVAHQEEMEHKARLETIEKLRLLKEKEQKKNDDDVIELYSDYEKANGNVKQIENDLLLLQRKEAPSDSSSVSSDEGLPHIYHVKSVEVTDERPKSATQLIKEQIELEQNHRKTSFKFVNSKTAPVNLYGMKLPHSASEKRTIFSNERRNLRSAGDSVFIISNLPNSVPRNSVGDGFHINNFDGKQKLPPLESLPKHNLHNGLLIRHSSFEENVVSVVEVD